MDDLIGHSITYRVAMGPRSGQKVFTLPSVPVEPLEEQRKGLRKPRGFRPARRLWTLAIARFMPGIRSAETHGVSTRAAWLRKSPAGRTSAGEALTVEVGPDVDVDMDVERAWPHELGAGAASPGVEWYPVQRRIDLTSFDGGAVMAVKDGKQRARFSATVRLVAIIGVLALPLSAWAIDPCCSITSIDGKTGRVEGRETTTGRLFQFQVSDRSLLQSLHIGQGLYADFAAGRVGIDPLAPCCNIVVGAASVAPVLRPTANPATPCCNSVANAALKAGMGRLVLVFPKEVDYRFSSVEVTPARGGKALKYYGANTLDLAPGQYDVAVSGSHVSQVAVTPGHETHVLTGGLRVEADAKTRVEVWDAGETRMLQFAIGNAVLGLPVGHYAVKVGQGTGTFTDVAVEDGKVVAFQAAASRAPTGAGGAGALAAAGSTGVACDATGKRASYLAPDAKIRGVCSPASDNPNNEPDPVPAGVPLQHVAGIVKATGAITTRRLASTNDGKQILARAVQGLGGFQMHMALLGGHTYMVNDCLGIKASAGTFDLVVPPPSLTFGATSATISFGVGHIGLDAFTVRLRPDPTDVLQPCHFSGRIGIGGSMDEVKFSMTVDPLYDIETCQVMALNINNVGWSIGSFRLAPLPPPVTGVAKEMMVDAMDYFTGLGLQDKFLQNLSDQLTPNHVIASTVCKNLH